MNKAEIEEWISKNSYDHDLLDWIIATDKLRELLVDYALVPRVPSVEMKVKLMGEFTIPTIRTCPDCDGQGCEICGDVGALTSSVDVPWVTIKEIYKAIVAAAENDTSSGVIVQEGGK